MSYLSIIELSVQTPHNSDGTGLPQPRPIPKQPRQWMCIGIRTAVTGECMHIMAIFKLNPGVQFQVCRQNWVHVNDEDAELEGQKVPDICRMPQPQTRVWHYLRIIWLRRGQQRLQAQKCGLQCQSRAPLVF